MAVRFVLGRSGTGKTRHCIDAVTAALRDGPPEQPLVLLVPEQASFQAERSILAQGDIAGYSRLQVLSFDRLGFLLAGPPQAQRVLTRIGREMIVYSILRKTRETLSIFARAADTAGLARHLARIILELHQSAKQPQDIQQLLAELALQPANARIGRKFADIAVVFEHYQQFLTHNSDIFLDPDQQLTQVERRVADCSRLKGARLWVDGLRSRQEQSLLISLMKV
jgi:ATP-dependent helicase/nuclease subunit B